MLTPRILHLSDLHGDLKKLHKALISGQAFDWIVLSGDIAFTHVKYITTRADGFRLIDRVAEAEHQLEWAKNALLPLVSKIPHKKLIIINGNHDFCDYGLAFPDAITLHKGAKTVEIDGVKVGMAVGIKPLYFEWFEELEEYDFSALLDSLDPEIQVLITHAPAAQVLDLTYGTEHVGYTCLYSKLFGLSAGGIDPHFTKLELHLFGHAHDSAGLKEIDVDGRTIVFSNAACCANVIDLSVEEDAKIYLPARGVKPLAKVQAPTVSDAFKALGSGGDI